MQKFASLSSFCLLLLGCPQPQQADSPRPRPPAKRKPQTPTLAKPQTPLSPSTGLLRHPLKRASSGYLQPIKFGTVRLTPNRKKAQHLNTLGFRLYKKKLFAKALAQFRLATKADPTYAMAHWNLACTLGVLRKLRKICPHNAFLSTILDALERAKKLTPSYTKKMKTDPDLSPIRRTLRYQRWLGHSAKNTRALPRLLKNVDWFGAPKGAYGPTTKLKFGKNKVEFRALDRNTFKWQIFRGTYTIKGRRITLRLKKPYAKKTSFRGEITPKGTLQIFGVDKFTDNPSDCEA